MKNIGLLAVLALSIIFFARSIRAAQQVDANGNVIGESGALGIDNVPFRVNEEFSYGAVIESSFSKQTIASSEK